MEHEVDLNDRYEPQFFTGVIAKMLRELYRCKNCKAYVSPDDKNECEGKKNETSRHTVS